MVDSQFLFAHPMIENGYKSRLGMKNDMQKKVNGGNGHFFAMAQLVNQMQREEDGEEGKKDS